MKIAKFLLQQRSLQTVSTANINATTNETQKDQNSAPENIIDHVFSIATFKGNPTITEPVPFIPLTNKAIPVRLIPSKEISIPADVTVATSLHLSTDSLVIVTNAPPSDTLSQIIPNATTDTKGTILPARYHTRRYTASTSTTIQANKSENDKQVAGPSKHANTTATKKDNTQSRVTRQMENSVKPLGPRHLEYDFHVARGEFKEMVYEELAKLGYPGHIRPSRKGKERAAPWEPSADQLALLKNSRAYKKAAQKLNDADHALDKALEAGNTWDNTEVPLEYTWKNEELKNYIDSLDKNSASEKIEGDVALEDKDPITEEQQIDQSTSNEKAFKKQHYSKKARRARETTTKNNTRTKKQTATARKIATKNITNSANRSALNNKINANKRKPLPKTATARNSNKINARPTRGLSKRKREEEIVQEENVKSKRAKKLTITIPAIREKRSLEKSKYDPKGI